MLLQESQSALNNVVVIFLGLAEKQQLQKTHQTESWNTDSDSSSLHLCDSYQTQFSRCNIKSQSILEDTITNQQLNNESVYQAKDWLQKSRVIDYVNHQMLINQIAKCIEDDVQLNLKVYKKKK
ncbi:hypothetical protein ABPG72_005301 [Tetrahymena utriculariae]